MGSTREDDNIQRRKKNVKTGGSSVRIIADFCGYRGEKECDFWSKHTKNFEDWVGLHLRLVGVHG